MIKICSYERAIDEFKEEQEKKYQQEISNQFTKVLENWFYEAINKYIEEGNDYSKDKIEVVNYVWKYVKSKI